MEDNRMESGNEIIELLDEDGKSVRFEHLMTVEYEGDPYVLLVPIDEVEDVDDDEVIIMRIETSKDGEDAYVGIEDEELLEKIFERYLEIAEADEEALEEEEDKD